MINNCAKVKFIKLFFLFIILLLFFSCERNTEFYTECNQYTDIEIDFSKINRKVIIIGIDGFRSDAMQLEITPFMHSLVNKNNTFYTPNHIVEGITYSGPNWSSILTGVNLEKHNVTDNSFSEHRYDVFPPFFHYLELLDHNINTVSIVNWLPINTYLSSIVADFSPVNSVSDLEVFNNVKNLLLNGDPIYPDVLFIQFDELDIAGHSYGFSPNVEEYAAKLTVLDNYVSDIHSIIDSKRLIGEDWIFLIVSDHGGDGTAHGDASNSYINQTICFIEHPDLEFKMNSLSTQADIVPTILDFLGVYSDEFDCKTDGNSLLLN